MKILKALLVPCLSIGITGALAGCSVHGEVDPAHSTSTSGTSSSYKKTEVRDANGNLVEKKVETRTGN